MKVSQAESGGSLAYIDTQAGKIPPGPQIREQSQLPDILMLPE